MRQGVGELPRRPPSFSEVRGLVTTDGAYARGYAVVLACLDGIGGRGRWKATSGRQPEHFETWRASGVLERI